MVEIKTLELENRRFVLIQLFLPHWTCRMIACTKGVLVDPSWNIHTLDERNLIAIQGTGRSFQELLDQNICEVTTDAAKLGIDIEMSGKEALLRMTDEKEAN